MCSESLFPRPALCRVNKLRSTWSVNRVDGSPLEKCEFFVGGERETDCKHRRGYSNGDEGSGGCRAGNVEW